MTEGHRGVFLDRDGVLNARRLTLVRKPAHLRVLPGVPEAIARLTEAGYRVLVVTNQSGVGYGLIDPGDLEAIHAKLEQAVAAVGGRLDAIYASTSRKGAPDSDAKPRPDMLQAGAKALGLDPGRCWMVGDKPSDIEAGRTFGARTIQVTGQHFPWDHLRRDPDALFRVHDLPEAVDVILAEDGLA